jgi:putative PEP-CTERM system histidine kinase
LDNIVFYTHLIGATAFGVLATLMLLHWRVRPLGPVLFFACLSTAGWATTIALGTLAVYPPISLIQLAEALRNGFWLFLLLQLVSLQTSGSAWRWGGLRWPPAFTAASALLLAVIGQGALPEPLLEKDLRYDLTLGLWLFLAVAALLLIEQLYRNAGKEERWSLKFFCLSLGGLFAYDFFMYAEALLFRRLDAELWQARGVVTAIVAPWLAIAIARNRAWSIGLEVSRHVVFHSVTLMGAGLYLLAMALIGYFIKYLGGSWGGVLQLSFLAASAALLLSLLFSGRLRAQLRVFVSKHFFSYRYDYRVEWLKFTEALAGLTGNVEEGVIRTMAPLAGCNAGLLFGAAGDDGAPRLLADWNMPAPPAARLDDGNLPAWLARTGWVVDLRERERVPELYEGLTLPTWMELDSSLWLAIPLMFTERVEGILVLRESNVKDSLNWEDRDLLKTAGRQAASHLAQHLASKDLAEARQFDAFNRLSAYVIHDLKNILAQQSLIVSNAAKHRDNPAFVDDMISTVANSVTRMQRLMEQMRSGERSAHAGRVELRGLLEDVASSRSTALPAPRTDLGALDLYVEADRERLSTVFCHLVQNAQEATPPEGEVRLTLGMEGRAAQVTVSDTGRGMDADFVRERLFRPFESTKGLTGMGIGAFESREYIRQLGGDITVESEPDRGSVFRVTIKLATAPAIQSDKEVAA